MARRRESMEIGVVQILHPQETLFQEVADFGLGVCQLINWDPAFWTKEVADLVVRRSKETGVRICALWAGVPGPCTWNFTEGPKTLGLVPPKYRQSRVAALKKGVEFAARLGVPAMVTHCGFIPETDTHPWYEGTVKAVRQVAQACKKKGLEFWFETGQETPTTLLRLFEDVGTGNLGVNLDPANLVLYGKANPVDSLDVFGKLVRCVHAKDGFYPTQGRELGKEVPVGKGKVDFPALLRGLKKLRYKGELIIEREIAGAQQKKDIRKTVTYLKSLKRRLR